MTGARPGRGPGASRAVGSPLGLAALPAVRGSLGSAAPPDRTATGCRAGRGERRPAYDPSAHRWGFVIDTTTCIGCGRCVEACKLENHVPEDPELNRTWVELHVLAQDGSASCARPRWPPRLPGGGVAARGAAATVRDAYFVPRPACSATNPPCTWVCPVSATFRTRGRRGPRRRRALHRLRVLRRRLPVRRPLHRPGRRGAAEGHPGVADKCTFCYHRTTRGQLPACAEVCPVNARIFGDLKDATSPVSAALNEKREPG